MIDIHHFDLRTKDIADEETLTFCRDLASVMTSLHQGMPIIGPWMEARIKQLIQSWLPIGWTISGPTQMYKEGRGDIRSRSWDIVIHKNPTPELQLPPPGSNDSGYPLLPTDLVAVVIDTKTNFNDPKAYAEQPVFNLMNDAKEPQLDFLGPEIKKMVFAASSSRHTDAISKAGSETGLLVFSLGRYRASPVSDGLDRKTVWCLERLRDGSYPMQAFKRSLLDCLEGS